MTQDKLIEAAKAVVSHWDKPNWKEPKHTRDYIGEAQFMGAVSLDNDSLDALKNIALHVSSKVKINKVERHE